MKTRFETLVEKILTEEVPIPSVKQEDLPLIKMVPEFIMKTIESAVEMQKGDPEFGNTGMRISYIGERKMEMRKGRPQIFKRTIGTARIGLKYERGDGKRSGPLPASQEYIYGRYLLANRDEKKIFVMMYNDPEGKDIETTYFIKEKSTLVQIPEDTAKEDCLAEEFRERDTANVEPKSLPFQYNVKNLQVFKKFD